MTPQPTAPDQLATRPECDANTLSDDAFLGGALNLLQPKTGYRAGIDAVLLAATVPTQPPTCATPLKVLDVGAGVGTVAMCVARRIENTAATLIEKSHELTAIAHQNRERNNLNQRVKIVTGDIGAPAATIEDAGLPAGSFDYVLANPPFHSRGKGTPSISKLKSNAHAMDEHDLDHWIRFMVRMARPGGTATLIHKAEALDRLLDAMRARFGAIRILPLYPRDATSANRVIITGIKGSKAELTICQPLVLHTTGHQFTDQLNAILRGGNGLDFTT